MIFVSLQGAMLAPKIKDLAEHIFFEGMGICEIERRVWKGREHGRGREGTGEQKSMMMWWKRKAG